jgi:hypothetical protein
MDCSRNKAGVTNMPTWNSAYAGQCPCVIKAEEHAESSGQVWSICDGFFLNEFETVEAILDGKNVYNQFTPCLRHLPIYEAAKAIDDEKRKQRGQF